MTAVTTPNTAVLSDSYGRVATDLRVSLTDRCSLRCSYCMPAHGLPWLASTTLLTDDEVVRLIRLSVTHLGVREVRFTGGEPLLRSGLVDIVARSAGLGVPVAMTTNGIGLAEQADALARAGMTRVNISLDTLQPQRFRDLTHRDRLHDVLAGIEAAQAAGLAPVKINTVLVRGINDDEAPDLLQFCLSHGLQLRFIEQMPLDADRRWNRDGMVTAAEIVQQLSEHYRLTPHTAERGSAPAELFCVDDSDATVGIIASVTRPFCRDCARTRLTADGQVRACLFAATETDLRTMLRDGADDDQLAATWRQAMWGKADGHRIGRDDFTPASRSMSAIGG